MPGVQANLRGPCRRDRPDGDRSGDRGRSMKRLIFLIGYRGSGKSTVGRLLAERVGWTFVDADAVIEERAGKSIRQIFADEGESGFRDREANALSDLCSRTDTVIATGGGVVL